MCLARAHTHFTAINRSSQIVAFERGIFAAPISASVWINLQGGSFSWPCVSTRCFIHNQFSFLFFSSLFYTHTHTYIYIKDSSGCPEGCVCTGAWPELQCPRCRHGYRHSAGKTKEKERENFFWQVTKCVMEHLLL